MRALKKTSIYYTLGDESNKSEIRVRVMWSMNVPRRLGGKGDSWSKSPKDKRTEGTSP